MITHVQNFFIRRIFALNYVGNSVIHFGKNRFFINGFLGFLEEMGKEYCCNNAVNFRNKFT
jgi:hypothetical protein